LNVNCPFQHEEGQQPNQNRVWMAAKSAAERKFAVENVEERVVVGAGLEGGQPGETAVHE
jgi:hypothetical protein